MALGILAVAVAYARARIDGQEVARLIAAIGPGLALVPIPYLLMLLLDALGWRLLLPPARRGIGLARLMRARAVAEAVGVSLPSAGVASEAVALHVLNGQQRVPVAEGLASLAARRVLVVLGHGLVLAMGALVCALGAAPVALPGQLWLLAVAAGALLALAWLIPQALVKGSLAERAHRTLRTLPGGRLRSWLDRNAGGFPETDRELARVFRRGFRAQAAATLLYLTIYLAEVGETWLILRLLGAGVGFVQVLSFESLLSLLRVVVFFLPAGLGVQDLGYVAVLHGLGLPRAASLGAAFVVLKRLKELSWMAAGYLLLLAPRRKANDQPERPAQADPLRLRLSEPDHADAPDRPRAARA